MENLNYSNSIKKSQVGLFEQLPQTEVFILGIIFAIICGISVAFGESVTALIILGIICSLILISRPFLVLCILVSLIGLEALNIIQPRQYYTLTGIKIVGLILIISLVPSFILRTYGVRFSKEIFFISAFLLGCFASILKAEKVDLSIISMLTLLQLVILWGIVRTLVDNIYRVKILSLVTVIVYCISAVLGIYQFYTDPLARITGTSQNSSIFAADLAVALSLCAALLFTAKVSSARKILFILLAVLVTAFLFTLSRAAYLALIPSIIVASAYYGKTRRGVVFLVLFIIAVVIFAPFTIRRLAETSTITDASTRGHLYSIKAGVEIMKDNLFLGVGLGNYPEHYLRYTNDPRALPRTAHNSYISIGSESGIFTLAAFLIFNLMAFYTLWKTSRRQRLNKDYYGLAYSTAIAFSLSMFFLISFFHSLYFQKYFWILLALASKFPETEGQPELNE